MTTSPQAPDFLRFFVQPVLCIPIIQSAQDFQPVSFETSEGELVLVFSTALNLARFFEKEQEFTEVAPQASIALALERGASLGFDLEQPHGTILSTEDLQQVQEILHSQAQIDEAREFCFEVFEPRPDLLRDLAQLLEGSNLPAHLMKDRDRGLVLLLQTSKAQWEPEFLLNLQAGLFRIYQSSKIDLALIAQGDRRLERYARDIEAVGYKIESSAHDKAAKPPILRY